MISPSVGRRDPMRIPEFAGIQKGSIVKSDTALQMDLLGRQGSAQRKRCLLLRCGMQANLRPPAREIYAVDVHLRILPNLLWLARFGRPVHLGFPHRLRPGTSPHALRIPLTVDTLPSEAMAVT